MLQKYYYGHNKEWHDPILMIGIDPILIKISGSNIEKYSPFRPLPKPLSSQH